jgi:predicted nuclease of predicted toxin-antitoxin system
VKFLANENFPLPSIHKLRELGYDVISIGETAPSISDEDVMSLAIETQRTILTFDKDYGELIFKYGYKPPAGVIFLRIQHFLPAEPGEIIHDLLTTQITELNRIFIVFDGEDIRRRSY